MCALNDDHFSFQHVHFTSQELVKQVRLFKKYNVLNLSEYVLNDHAFMLPFIDYARVYVSAGALDIAKSKNINFCRFVSEELNLLFFENLLSTPNKLNHADSKKLTKRTKRLRNASPHRTTFMPGIDDWYTGVPTICAMIHLPGIEELPTYKIDVPTILTPYSRRIVDLPPFMDEQ